MIGFSSRLQNEKSGVALSLIRQVYTNRCQAMMSYSPISIFCDFGRQYHLSEFRHGIDSETSYLTTLSLMDNLGDIHGNKVYCIYISIY